MNDFRMSLPAHYKGNTSSPIHLVITILMLFSSMTVQALDLLSPFKDFLGEDETIIWQDQGQFVKLVEQDWDWDRSGRKHAPVNSHPVNLTPEQIAMVLASIKTSVSTGTKNRLTVFTASEAALLSGYIAEALGKARAKEDIVFAVMDRESNRSTAGRLFFLDGRLNIIFGDLLVPVKEAKSGNISHYAKPHRAGKRKESIEDSTQLMSANGINHLQHNGRGRPDWLVIDVKKVIAGYKGPEIPASKKKVAEAASKTPETVTNTQQESSAEDQNEKRQLREEVARLRKELKEARSTRKDGGEEAKQIIDKISEPAAEMTIEQRMLTLKSLHEKALISDEEYEAKRLEILNEL